MHFNLFLLLFDIVRYVNAQLVIALQSVQIKKQRQIAFFIKAVKFRRPDSFGVT